MMAASCIFVFAVDDSRSFGGSTHTYILASGC